MKRNLKNRPVKSTPQRYEEWIKGFEEDLRLFISIHENEGHMIDPELARKEILGE